MQNFETFKRYKFDHQEDGQPTGSMPQLLGLSSDFSDMVMKTVKKECIDCDTWGQAIENTFNKVLPNNAIEAFWIGWVAAKMYDHNDQQAKIQNLMDMLRRG